MNKGNWVKKFVGIAELPKKTVLPALPSALKPPGPTSPIKKLKRLGWKKDRLDSRDIKFGLDPTLWAKLVAARPTSYDPRANFDPCYDQGDLGSCVGNGTAGDMQYIYKTLKKVAYMPSRLMIYYDARAMEGTVSQDDGCEIRDAIKSLNSQGACDETVWPYNIAKFTVKPPTSAYTEGKLHETVQYATMTQSDIQLETRLSMGYPVVVGILVYDSFMTDAVAASGIVPMPNAGLPWQKNMPGPVETLQGGHCVLLIGYNNPQRVFIARNSWGTSWGQNGYFTIPMDYICCSDLGSDFWTIELVE